MGELWNGLCYGKDECPFCYLRDSGLDIHENCCLGVQRHLPTYMKRGRFQYGPETLFQMGVSQIWYLVSVTACIRDGG
jgi:hypothetical protein